MFQLKVTGIGEAKYSEHLYTKIIGLIDPSTKPVDTETEYHIERFHDVPMDYDGYTAPTIDNIRNVLDFSKKFTNDDKVLVHCHAGISRSTAVSVLICIQHGMSIEKAFDLVYSIRDCMSPNILIIKYGDELLGCNGDLMDYLSRWYFDKNVKYGAFAGQDKGDTAIMKDILNMFK